MNDIVQRGSDALAQLEDSKSKTRIWLRSLFESDPNVREILGFFSPVHIVKPHLVEMLSEQSDDPLIPEILDELLAELEQQRATEPGLYLIDQKTGKSIMRLREGAVFQPPNYVGVDGIVRKAKPIVHPGITAPLLMKIHEESKLARATENLKSTTALSAITNPNSIIQYAEMKLRAMGFEVGPVDNGTVENIEIGREYYDPTQSINDNFHRHSVFGTILAKKVVDGMGNFRRCELSPAIMEKNAKQRWYKVSVTRAS